MALTAWEGLKVVGKTLEAFGETAEKYEDANPGMKYVPDTGAIVGMVVAVLKDIGVEVLD